MAIKVYKPTTPGLRGMTSYTFDEITKSKPERSLVYKKTEFAGRDAQGHEYLGRYYFELGRLKTAQLNLEKAISRYGINSPEAARLIPLVDEIKKYPAYL